MEFALGKVAQFPIPSFVGSTAPALAVGSSSRFAPCALLPAWGKAALYYEGMFFTFGFHTDNQLGSIAWGITY